MAPMLLRVAIVCLSLLAPACGSRPRHTTQPTATATDKVLINVDERSVGLGGNDPISYCLNAADNKAKADANWPGLVATHGK